MTTASDYEAVTISEESDSAVRQVNLPHGNPPRSARARASSVATASEIALSPRHSDVTERDDEAKLPTVQEKAQQAADDLAERVKAKFAALAGGPSLLHAHPPTLAQVHKRAHECAAHHSTPLMSFLCLAYRYLHMGLVKFPCHVLEWCTDSFPKLLVTAAVVFIAIHWI